VSIETDARTISVGIVRLLKEEREKRKLSRYALSQLSGLSQQTLGNVERGSKSPTFETMWRMAVAMDLDLSRIIKKAARSVREGK
jgi:transcriptional regulator with XRE-family HTH domain